MELKMEILCTEFKHKKILDNKIIVDEKSEEYYIVPLTKEFSVDEGEGVYKLSFKNQLLWLKYSNHNKEILINEYEFEECVLIESKNIIDIYMNLHTNHCFRKNVWQSNNNVRLNSDYAEKHMLILPIIEDMIDIKEFGIGITNYQISMISNEILLKQTIKDEHNCHLFITNNFLLNKDALFVKLNDNDVQDFIGVAH